MADAGILKQKSDERRQIDRYETNQKTNDGRGSLERKDKETKQYPCNECNFQFPFKSELDRHLMVHTNAKPFKCERCEKSYKYPYDLIKHMKKHHTF